MSLTRRRVPLFVSFTGWADHERVPLGPSARQDACRLPQLQVVTDQTRSCHGSDLTCRAS